MLGVSIAVQSVVAVRWAFRQHAAAEVGILVRAPRRRRVSWYAAEVGVLVRSSSTRRRRWVS